MGTGEWGPGEEEEADVMEEFNDKEDFKITLFAFMHRGSIDDGISFLDVIDFMRREGVMIIMN